MSGMICRFEIKKPLDRIIEGMIRPNLQDLTQQTPTGSMSRME